MIEEGFCIEIAEMKALQQRELGLLAKRLSPVDLVESRPIAEADDGEVSQGGQVSKRLKTDMTAGGEARERL